MGNLPYPIDLPKRSIDDLLFSAHRTKSMETTGMGNVAYSTVHHHINSRQSLCQIVEAIGGNGKATKDAGFLR